MAQVDRGLLASDAEREAAVDRLRDASGEGRLGADELEDRVRDAYAARTRAELDVLVADLPTAPAVRALAVPDAERSEQLRRRTAGFLTPNLVCLVVWLATGAAGGFWPGWVLLGTGLAYVTYVVRYVLGVEDHHEHQPRERHRHRGALPRPPR